MNKIQDIIGKIKNTPIKFRSWDGKEMILLDSFYEIQRQNLTKEEVENVLFLQFTGLLDKNGNEIFVGDILKFFYFQKPLGEKEGNDEEIIGVCLIYPQNGVRCVVGETHFLVHENHAQFPNWEDFYTHDFEIIGNVFENPELIENL